MNSADVELEDRLLAKRCVRRVADRIKSHQQETGKSSLEFKDAPNKIAAAELKKLKEEIRSSLRYSLDSGKWTGVLTMLETELDFHKFTEAAELVPSRLEIPKIEIPKIDIENLRDEAEIKKQRKEQRKKTRQQLISTPRINEDNVGLSSPSPSSSSNLTSPRTSEPCLVEDPIKTKEQNVQMNEIDSSNEKDLGAYAEWLEVERALVLAEQQNRNPHKDVRTQIQQIQPMQPSVVQRSESPKHKSIDIFTMPIIPSMPIIEKQDKGLQVEEKKPEKAEIGIETEPVEFSDQNPVLTNSKQYSHNLLSKEQVDRFLSSSSLDETSEEDQRIRTVSQPRRKIGKLPRVRDVSESRGIQRHHRRRSSPDTDQIVEVLSAKIEKESIGIQAEQPVAMVDEAVGSPRAMKSVATSARSPRPIKDCWQPFDSSASPFKLHETEISSSSPSTEGESNRPSGALPLLLKPIEKELSEIGISKRANPASITRPTLSAALFSQADEDSSISPSSDLETERNVSKT